MPYEVAHKDKAVLLFESAEQEPWHVGEMRDLCDSAGVTPVAEFFSRQKRRYGQQFISSDRAEELFETVTDHEADVVVVGSDLPPAEHAQLQEVLDVRVVDRTQLILDIFAQRAHTREGKLQVELAQLNYLLPRLIGAGKAMSRLGGGVGTRGPGETKLEMDRRRLRQRISALGEEIDAVRRHRDVSRSARRKLPFPSAALVGYTSAGKSTLLNALSGSEIEADARLFSTLDPTTRRVVLPDGWAFLLTDTVGFIRDLPHPLIAAFRSTLEELLTADILIHVIDASHPNVDEQMAAVRETLDEIGVDESRPVIEVYNKSDLLTDTYDLRRRVALNPLACYISAERREGLSYLIAKIGTALDSLLVHIEALIPYDRSDLLSSCYDYGHVLQADYQDGGIRLSADVARSFSGNLAPFLVSGSS